MTTFNEGDRVKVVYYAYDFFPGSTVVDRIGTVVIPAHRVEIDDYYTWVVLDDPIDGVHGSKHNPLLFEGGEVELV